MADSQLIAIRPGEESWGYSLNESTILTGVPRCLLTKNFYVQLFHPELLRRFMAGKENIDAIVVFAGGAVLNHSFTDAGNLYSRAESQPARSSDSHAFARHDAAGSRSTRPFAAALFAGTIGGDSKCGVGGRYLGHH